MTPSAFRAFTFDCYGTLIDWEQGMLRALRTLAEIDANDDSLLAAFARHEHAIQEENPALRYPDVLSRACKTIAADFGHTATDQQAAAFGASIADWPPFPDSVEALAYLREHGLLMVLSNVDRASFGHSAKRLGDPFHAVVTAEDVGSYKPAPAHFERATALLADEGIAPEPGAPRGPEPLPRRAARPCGRLFHLLDRPPRGPPRRRDAAGGRRAGHHLHRPRLARRLAPLQQWLNTGRHSRPTELSLMFHDMRS